MEYQPEICSVVWYTHICANKLMCWQKDAIYLILWKLFIVYMCKFQQKKVPKSEKMGKKWENIKENVLFCVYGIHMNKVQQQSDTGSVF